MVYSKVSKKATAVEELLTTPPPSPSHGRQFSHRVHHCAVCKKVATDRCLETCRAWRCESHPLTIIMRGYDCLACKGKEIAEERKRKEELAKANTEVSIAMACSHAISLEPFGSSDANIHLYLSLSPPPVTTKRRESISGSFLLIWSRKQHRHRHIPQIRRREKRESISGSLLLSRSRKEHQHQHRHNPQIRRRERKESISGSLLLNRSRKQHQHRHNPQIRRGERRRNRRGRGISEGEFFRGCSLD